jgi:uncharacterized membrane protein
VYQIGVLVHLLAAVVWVGGMLFLALVVVPSTRGLAPDQRAGLFDALGRRFRPIGWACVALLVATGLLSLTHRGVTWEDALSGQLLGTPFGRLLGLKLALVAAMLVLSALHDFVVGPASTRALTDPDGSARGRALRRRASWLARVSTLLALAVVALAVALVRGLPG